MDHPYDAPADYPVEDSKPTGLLTRFVPAKIRNSSAFSWLLRLTRGLQFISSVISLGAFSYRLARVYRLVNNIKQRTGVNRSFGAVEGILAASVLYTLLAMLLGCIKKNSSPGSHALRWIWVLLDLAFLGAFIAVAVLTSPNGGLAGPKHCYAGRNPTDFNSINNATGATADSTDKTCNLPWVTFILAIISTLLHAITAAFHEVKDHRRRNRGELTPKEQEKLARKGHA